MGQPRLENGLDLLPHPKRERERTLVATGSETLRNRVRALLHTVQNIELNDRGVVWQLRIATKVPALMESAWRTPEKSDAQSLLDHFRAEVMRMLGEAGIVLDPHATDDAIMHGVHKRLSDINTRRDHTS